jgi:phospholipase C
VGLADIKHVVILMQENRSFDQHLGTLLGAAGFSDPNFPSASSIPYLPFRASTFTTNGEAYIGDNHFWPAMHSDYTPGSGCLPLLSIAGNLTNGVCPGYGYSAANDIPYHWILANTFTVCDHWFASVLGPTASNRLYLMSGCLRSPMGGTDRAPETIGDPNYGTGKNDESGNPIVNYGNNPLEWESYPVILKNAFMGVANPPITWNVYDETGATSYYCDPLSPNFIPPPNTMNGWGTMNVLNSFADNSGSNWNGGTGQGFIADAQAGTLPTISWIIPPFGASEWHNFASDGAQYIAQKLDAILTKQADGSSVWNSTVFIVLYDENDGAFDHVDPQPVTNPPTGTNAQGQPAPPIAGTVEDFVASGSTPMAIGPGYRSPAIIISPWTVSPGKQAGWNISGAQPNVQSAPCDHTAVLQLLELVTASLAPPNGVPCTNIGAWRRWRFNCGMDFWNNIFQGAAASADEVRAMIPVASEVTQYQINTQARLSPYHGNGAYNPAPSPNAPWPPVQQQCYFQVLSQTSFGLDDVNAAQQLGTSFTYSVVLDGFDANEMAGLTIVTTPQPNPPPPRGLYPTLYVSLSTTDPFALQGMEVSITNITPSPTPAPVNQTPAVSEPQRWTVFFDLVFNNPAVAFKSVNLMTSVPLTLTTTFSSNLDWSESIPIELVQGADPYMLAGVISYLARDVRVYEVLDDGTANNPFGIEFGPDPNTYIQSVLTKLNEGNPSNIAALATMINSFKSDPGAAVDPDAADEAFSQASSFPTLNGTPGAPNIYNFAIARVTLQGLTQPAKNVQVFFRLFPAPSAGTYYYPTTFYPYATDSETNQRLPTIGFTGSEVASIPFFAASRSDVAQAGLDLPNWQATIQPLASGEPVYTYFACYIDNNHGAEVKVNNSMVPISSLAASQHQCIVAEIYFPGVIIQTGDNPGTDTDKLEQRNIAFLGGTP